MKLLFQLSSSTLYRTDIQVYLTMGPSGSLFQILSLGTEGGACPLVVISNERLPVYRGLVGNADDWVVGADPPINAFADMPWQLYGIFIYNYQVCVCVGGGV